MPRRNICVNNIKAAERKKNTIEHEKVKRFKGLFKVESALSLSS